MIPRLNQTLYKFTSKTTDAYGGNSFTAPVPFIGRLTEGQSTSYSSRGKEAEYDASLHAYPTPELSEGDIIQFETTYYSIISVTRTRDLDGNVLFQFCRLAKEAGVTIV